MPEEEGSLSLGEKAVRLSFAALQGIPEESAKVRSRQGRKGLCLYAGHAQGHPHVSSTAQRTWIMQGYMTGMAWHAFIPSVPQM